MLAQSKSLADRLHLIISPPQSQASSPSLLPLPFAASTYCFSLSIYLSVLSQGALFDVDLACTGRLQLAPSTDEFHTLETTLQVTLSCSLVDI